MEKLRTSHGAALAKQKADHEAEVAKLIREQEEEREERAREVLEAKAHALKVQRKHQYAQRDYRKAKTSCKLQAQRTKAMEAEGEQCIALLKEMDEQLSRKFSFGYHPNLNCFSFHLQHFPSVCFRRSPPCRRWTCHRGRQISSGASCRRG